MGFGERETLTAPRRARSVVFYVMAGRVDIREGSRDVQLQAISDVQRPCVLDVQHATWQAGLRLGRGVDDQRAHGNDAADTVQSTAETSVVSRAISDSVNRPSACVPGSTRSGLLSGRESSRCRRRATTLRQGGGGRERVGNSGLGRPRTPLGNLAAFTKRRGSAATADIAG